MSVAEGALLPASERRKLRSRLHRFVRETSPRAGARECLVTTRADGVRVRVAGRSGRGHVSGLKRCASPWACPVCAPKIRQRRGDEITRVVEAARERGGGAMLVTIALPHGPDDPLTVSLDRLQAVWRAMWAGGWSARFRARFGVVGSVRAVEATWGARTGWHGHIHAVVICDRPLHDDDVVAAWGALWLRFSGQCERLTGRKPGFVGGLDVRVVDDPRNVSEYVADTGGWSIGAEVAASTTKVGRSADRWSPFSLLAGAALHGDADAAALWREWEHATAGRKAIVASPGLMEAYGVSEVDEMDAAEGEEAADVIAEVEVSAEMWVVLAALDACDEFVVVVEEWAAAGCPGAPPDAEEFICALLARRAEERAR